MLRARLLAPLLAAAVLVPAAGADANVPKWKMSIEGTMTSTGEVTNSGCYPPNADAVQTMSGAAETTVRFRTTRTALITAQRITGYYPAINLGDDDRPLRGRATITRRSTLEDVESPLGCNTAPAEQDCGTETLDFDIGVGGGGDGRGIRPDLSKNGHKNRELFKACALTTGMNGFPSFTGGSGEAKLKASRLWGTRKIVIKGGKRGSDAIDTRTVKAKGSFDLRYTITLTRAG